jgi:predicted nicotinamide N-methyase
MRATVGLFPMPRAPLDLVDEEIDLGGGLEVCITRPRAPGRLLDDAVADGAGDAPYWAELWPSARALAAHLATLELRGVRAIELGCGLALPSVAAALRGAQVLAVDRDADAVRIARANGERAGGRVQGLVADLGDPPLRLAARGPFDLVLAADLLYDEALASSLAALIPRLTGRDGRVLVAFPWRGQADVLARTLEQAGMTVAFSQLPPPGLPRARAVGLLEAGRNLASNATN